MKKFNFHTHTLFCDGSAEPEAYVLEAIKNQMTGLGFTCHSPLPFENGYSIKENNIEEYVAVIRDLQEKYKGSINIFLGTEFDYVPGMSDDISLLRKIMKPDFFIASVHLVRNKENDKLWFIDGPEKNYTSGLAGVFNNDIRLAVTTYFNQITSMVSTLRPDMIGHVDKVKMHNKDRFFSENEKWYLDLVSIMLDAVQATNCIVEINTRGLYKKRCDTFYPGLKIMEEIYRRKIPVTISSDAHLPEELVLYYDEAAHTLKDIGFRSIKYFNGKTWEDSLL